MPACPACHEPVPDVRYCPFCGTELAPAPPDRGPIAYAFAYPLDRNWQPISFTALFLLFAFLLFPLVYVAGYAYRIGRAAVRNDPVPPSFGAAAGILRDGAIVIATVVPFVLLVCGAVLAPVVIAAQLDVWALTLLATPILLVGGYATGSLYATLLATGSVTATYRGFRFLTFARTRAYFTAVLLLVGIGLLVGTIVLVSGLLVFVSVAAVFVFLPVYLVVGAFMAYVPPVLLAYYYRTAAEDGAVPPPFEPRRLAATY